MATLSSPRRTEAELAPQTVEILQAATRVLAGVALRSLEALDGAVTLPQFRMLAVLADLGRARSGQVARALGLEASTVTRLAGGSSGTAMSSGAETRLTAASSRWSSPQPARIWSARSRPGGRANWRGSFIRSPPQAVRR